MGSLVMIIKILSLLVNWKVMQGVEDKHVKYVKGRKKVVSTETGYIPQSEIVIVSAPINNSIYNP